MSRRASAALLTAPLALLLLFFAYPLAFTLRAAASPDAWTWALTHPYPRSRLAIALAQAVLSAGLTLALALPLALFHHRRALPFGRLQLALHAAPFVLPVFVVVFGIGSLLGRDGILHDALGIDALGAVGPLGAVVLAHAYYNYGFAARLLHATLERRPRRLEDAARTLGASPRVAAWRVAVPLLWPSLASIALLVFVFAFASFGVVLYLGGGEVATLETLLYENQSRVFAEYDRAALVGLAQLALNAALLGAYVTLRRRAAGVPRDPPRPAPPATRTARAGAWALAALALLPAASVLVGAVRVGGEWTLEPLRALVDADHPSHLGRFDLGLAVANSLLYAASTVVASLALTLALAYGLRATGRGRRAIEVAASLPLGVSSLLLGFGYLLAFGAGSALDLRGSVAVIVLAHTLVAFPFTARVLLPALEEHDARLDEAAALLGASPRAVAWRVHLPLLRAPLLAAAGLAAAISLGDFGASLVLMRPDNMALSVWIHRHGGVGSFDPMMRAQARALAALLMLLAAGAYVLAEQFGGREARP